MLSHASYFSSRIEFLKRQPKGGVVVEVGVHCGDFAQLIFDIVQPDMLYLIDRWPDHDVYNGPVGINGLKCKEMVEERLASGVLSGRVQTIRGESVKATKHFEPSTLDMVYIDTSHWYPHTLHELRAYQKLIKPGGLLAGHDYNLFNSKLGFCGVEKSVTEFVAEGRGLLAVLTTESDYPQSFGIIV
jgi:hypothetical protein